MDLQTNKINVMQKLMNVSTPSLLAKIDQLLDQEMIVGYTINGEPLTKHHYNKRLQTAEKQVLKGDTVTQEDLENEVENW